MSETDYSTALQKMVRARLVGYAPLAALVGTRVLDAPKRDIAYPYITFGPSDLVPDDHDCVVARVETLQLDVWSKALDGQGEAKRICGLVKAALHDWQGALDVGDLWLLRVNSIRVVRDPADGITHGIVTLEAGIDEDQE